MKTMMAMLISAALLAGCQQDQTVVSKSQSAETTKAPSLTPEQLGEIGAQIQKEPDNAEQILDKHGLDEASFEKAVRNVTEDPEASKQYAEAYKKKS